MTGGKFQSGAVTSAFQYLYNEVGTGTLDGPSEGIGLGDIGRGLLNVAKGIGTLLRGVTLALTPSVTSTFDEGYFHYTTEKGLGGIIKDQIIKADTKGRVFVTPHMLGPEDANQVLFNGIGGGKGSHVLHFVPHQGVKFHPVLGGKSFYELVHYGNLKLGHVNVTYAGTNPFPDTYTK